MPIRELSWTGVRFSAAPPRIKPLVDCVFYQGFFMPRGIELWAGRRAAKLLLREAEDDCHDRQGRPRKPYAEDHGTLDEMGRTRGLQHAGHVETSVI